MGPGIRSRVLPTREGVAGPDGHGEIPLSNPKAGFRGQASLLAVSNAAYNLLRRCRWEMSGETSVASDWRSHRGDDLGAGAARPFMTASNPGWSALHTDGERLARAPAGHDHEAAETSRWQRLFEPRQPNRAALIVAGSRHNRI